MKVVRSRGIGKVCRFHSHVSNEMVIVIAEVPQYERRLVDEMWCVDEK